MLACSYCVDIPGPSWWLPVQFLLVGLALVSLVVGITVGLAALNPQGDTERTGGLLVAVGLVVLLPLAAFALYQRTTVYVTEFPRFVEESSVDSDRPIDQQGVQVRCESIQAGNDDEFTAACSDAATTRRWVAGGLAAASASLVIAGSALGHVRRRNDEAPATTSGVEAGRAR